VVDKGPRPKFPLEFIYMYNSIAILKYSYYLCTWKNSHNKYIRI